MKHLTKVMSVALVIAVLFTLGGCGALTKKITDEAKIKISEQLEETKGKDTDSEDTESSDDSNTEDTTQSDENTDSNSGDSTKITTSDSKNMDWPAKFMGDIKPVSCKVTAVYTAATGGTVAFEGMQRAEADKYITDFESMGFTTGYALEDDSGLAFIKTDTDGNSIMFTYAPDGTGTISYTPVSSS